MKKLLFLLIALFIFASTASAQTSLLGKENQSATALYVFLDPKGISDPTEIAESIYDQLKIELEKSGQTSVLPFDGTNRLLRRYIRENSTADTAREADSGFMTKQKDLIALAEEAQADYIFFVNARVSSEQLKMGFFGLRNKRTLLFEMVLTDKNAKDYLIDEVLSESASSTGTSYDRAFNKAMKALLEKVDFSKLNLAKQQTAQDGRRMTTIG